jgi:hypothetical protein
MYPDYWDEYAERMDDSPSLPSTKPGVKPVAPPIIWCSTPDCQVRVAAPGLCNLCKIRPDSYRMGGV